MRNLHDSKSGETDDARRPAVPHQAQNRLYHSRDWPKKRSG
jgi:hypothetical protein